MSALTIQGIQKSFGDTVALSDINLDIRSGEFICLLGASGCGKTTLLRQIAGLDFPDQGSIMLDGEDLLTVPCHQRNIGMVFQSLALFPHLNVIDNVGYALEIAGVNKATRLQRSQELLDLVGLTDLGKRRCSQLSGGQRQRVAIARALATNPRLFLMDEPFSALDAGLREHLQLEIKKLQQSLGITTIFVTHDQREAMALADRIIILNNGKVEQAGTPSEIYAQPKTEFVAEFIGENNIFEVESVDGKLHYQGAFIGNHKLANGKHKIAIRPEHLSLHPHDSKADGIVAEVTLIRSLGAMLETELKSGETIFVQTALTMDQSATAQIGSTLKIELNLDKIWVLPQC